MKKIVYLLIIPLLFIGGCIIKDDTTADNLNNASSGLELYITFDSQNAKDISGNGYNGVISGDNFITNTPGGSGYAYNIINEGDLIRVPYNPFRGLNEYSFCFWVRDPSQGLLMNAYGYNTSSSSSNYPTMRISDNLLYAAFDSYSMSSYFTYNPATKLQDGSWHHIAITAYNKSQKLYVDGTLVATQQQSVGESSSSEVHFGGVLDGYSGAIMKIDNIRIYNRAITQNEVELIIEFEQ